jgi:hypothetical protein
MKPKSVEEALSQARRHARAAAVEATAAVRALLDAAALGSTGRLSEDVRGLQAVGAVLDDVHGWLERGEGNTAVVVALAEALEAEIRRWEARSADDSEARAVLRAFLGLRELLWELGVRARSAEPAAPEPAPQRAAEGAPAPVPPESEPARDRAESRKPRQAARTARVHRIPVEG